MSPFSKSDALADHFSTTPLANARLHRQHPYSRPIPFSHFITPLPPLYTFSNADADNAVAVSLPPHEHTMPSSPRSETQSSAHSRKRPQQAISPQQTKSEQLFAKSVFYPENQTSPRNKCTEADVIAHVAAANAEMQAMANVLEKARVKANAKDKKAALRSAGSSSATAADNRVSNSTDGKPVYSKLITSETKVARIDPRFKSPKKTHRRRRAPSQTRTSSASSGYISNTIDAITARIARRQDRRADQKARDRSRGESTARKVGASRADSTSDVDVRTQGPKEWLFDQDLAHDWEHVTPDTFVDQPRGNSGADSVVDSNASVSPKSAKKKSKGKGTAPAASSSPTSNTAPRLVVAERPGLIDPPHRSLPPIDAMSVVRQQTAPTVPYEHNALAEPFATATEFPWGAAASSPSEPRYIVRLPRLSAFGLRSRGAALAPPRARSSRAHSIPLPSLEELEEGEHRSPAGSNRNGRRPGTPLVRSPPAEPVQRESSQELGVVNPDFRFPAETRVPLGPSPAIGAHQPLVHDVLPGFHQPLAHSPGPADSGEWMDLDEDQRDREWAFWLCNGFFPAMIAQPLRQDSVRASQIALATAELWRQQPESSRQRSPIPEFPFDMRAWRDTLPLVLHTEDFGSFYYPMCARDEQNEHTFANALQLDLFSPQSRLDEVGRIELANWRACREYHGQLVMAWQSQEDARAEAAAKLAAGNVIDLTHSSPAAPPSTPQVGVSSPVREQSLQAPRPPTRRRLAYPSPHPTGVVHYNDDEIDWDLIAQLGDNPAAQLAIDDDRLSMVGGQVGDLSGFLDEPIPVACYRHPVGDHPWRSPRAGLRSVDQTPAPSQPHRSPPAGLRSVEQTPISSLQYRSPPADLRSEDLTSISSLQYRSPPADLRSVAQSPVGSLRYRSPPADLRSEDMTSVSPLQFRSPPADSRSVAQSPISSRQYWSPRADLRSVNQTPISWQQYRSPPAALRSVQSSISSQQYRSPPPGLRSVQTSISSQQYNSPPARLRADQASISSQPDQSPQFAPASSSEARLPASASLDRLDRYFGPPGAGNIDSPTGDYAFRGSPREARVDRGAETASCYNYGGSQPGTVDGDPNVGKATAAYLRDHKLDAQFLQQYRITDQLGSGGYGFVCVAVVLEAQDFLPVGTEVAVKFLFKRRNGAKEGPSIVPMTRHIPTEAFILQTLDHEGIIKCYNVFEDEDMYYLVSLTSLLPLPRKRLLTMTRSSSSTEIPGMMATKTSSSTPMTFPSALPASHRHCHPRSSQRLKMPTSPTCLPGPTCREGPATICSSVLKSANSPENSADTSSNSLVSYLYLSTTQSSSVADSFPS